MEVGGYGRRGDGRETDQCGQEVARTEISLTTTASTCVVADVGFPSNFTVRSMNVKSWLYKPHFYEVHSGEEDLGARTSVPGSCCSLAILR